MPDTIITVITRDRLDFLKQCVESLLASDIGDAHLLVIDNGSIDGTYKWLKTVGRVQQIIKNQRNVPQWQKSYALRQMWKQVEASDAKYVSWVDDDMILKPEWLKAGKLVLDEREDVVAAAMHTDRLQERKHPTRSTVQIGDYEVRLKNTSNGPCWVVRRDFAEKFGIPKVTGRVDQKSMSDWYYDQKFLKMKPRPWLGVLDMSTHLGYKQSLRMVLQGKRKPFKIARR